MDEGLATLLTGLGIAVAFATPIIFYLTGQERKGNKLRVERAEEHLREGRLGKAYEEVKDVGKIRGQMYAAWKIRKRAKEIKTQVESSDLVKQIASEAKDSFGDVGATNTVYYDLNRGTTEVTYVRLGKVSKTYREHFLSPSEDD